MLITILKNCRVIKVLSVSLVARCDSVLSCRRVRTEYVSSLRRSGRSCDKTWLASFSILWKSLSSASSTISEMSVWSAAQKPLRDPRLTKSVIRFWGLCVFAAAGNRCVHRLLLQATMTETDWKRRLGRCLLPQPLLVFYSFAAFSVSRCRLMLHHCHFAVR